jgi:hypothetical protein
MTKNMINWNAIYLKCKCADLVASDRKKSGRQPGRAGEIRSDYERCAKAVADGLRKINTALTRAGY